MIASSGSMRAAVLEPGASRLVVTDVPRPAPGPAEVVVRVAGCGFCHTDLHYLDHGVRMAKPPPVVLGHEVSGTVEERGSEVADSWVGQRVVVPAVVPCGRCGLCQTGRGNICPDLRMLGNHIDGGFAEFVRVPADVLTVLPPEIDLVNGSVIADALSTPYHAVVHRARVRAGEWVAVVGCGGVGMNLVQFARAAGANVIAIDVAAPKRALARRLGAVEAIDPNETPDVPRAVRGVAPGGVDVAFEAVGRPATIELAVATLRRGGRACLVGYSDAPAPLPVHKIMFLEYSIVGSLGCRPADYPRVVELVRRGRVALDPLVTGRVPLDRVNDAADRLRRGEGLRTVVVPGPRAT
jgi:6-hydroxycyclohex-1-ene-1-carbonyl-CoA dehydrogenase